MSKTIEQKEACNRCADILASHKGMKLPVSMTLRDVAEMVHAEFHFHASISDYYTFLHNFISGYDNGEYEDYLIKRIDRVTFYTSKEWLALKQTALSLYGRCCMYCGDAREDTEYHVDHIISRQQRPDLELELSNVQILCRSCNCVDLHHTKVSNRDCRKQSDLEKLKQYQKSIGVA